MGSRSKHIKPIPQEILKERDDIRKVKDIICKIGMSDKQKVLDMYDLVKASYALGPLGKDLMLETAKLCKSGAQSLREQDDMQEVWWGCVKHEARHIFSSFMLYMEHKRPIEERFYQNRINPLHQVARGVQDLYDDNLDELFVNLPPRVGKTTIVRLAQLWYGSNNTELSNLYSAFSDKVTKPYFNGLSEFITDPTYAYDEIYPGNKIVRTNGDDETIDLNRKKTYPTFTCRSIDGSLNGSCDCNGLAVNDDLLSGIREAMSPGRLDTVWNLFDNNFMTRLKESAKLISMGTRWATADTQGRRQYLLAHDQAYANRRYRIISIPALTEDDKSNFDYPYNVGYSTQFYIQRRASFEKNDDMASWYAQFQQEPIDRHGALFMPENLNFYNGQLPYNDKGELLEPDRIYMAIDEAFGGGDYVSAPVCYQYGDTCYIHDVVFSNGDKYVTRPLIVDCILRNNVSAARFEETSTTADYREWIEGELKKRGFRCNIQRKAPGTRISKLTRILDHAPEIREFYFRDSNCRSSQYQKFMSNIYEYNAEGTAKHDDAPDSMAMLCDMRLKMTFGTKIVNSPI